MDRREALKTIVIGGTLFASSGVLAACARNEHADASTSRVLSSADQDLIEEIADTILPTTASSPGARAAGAGTAINLLLSDCYKPEDQQRVVRGLSSFRDACRERRKSSFAELPRQQREQFLREIDGEARQAGKEHYFHLVRELANTAYFSSEVGMTKALRYVQTPGRWVGCMPLQSGQPAWA